MSNHPDGDTGRLALDWKRRVADRWVCGVVTEDVQDASLFFVKRSSVREGGQKV